MINCHKLVSRLFSWSSSIKSPVELLKKISLLGKYDRISLSDRAEISKALEMHKAKFSNEQISNIFYNFAYNNYNDKFNEIESLLCEKIENLSNYNISSIISFYYVPPQKCR